MRCAAASRRDPAGAAAEKPCCSAKAADAAAEAAGRSKARESWSTCLRRARSLRVRGSAPEEVVAAEKTRSEESGGKEDGESLSGRRGPVRGALLRKGKGRWGEPRCNEIAGLYTFGEARRGAVDPLWGVLRRPLAPEVALSGALADWRRGRRPAVRKHFQDHVHKRKSPTVERGT